MRLRAPDNSSCREKLHWQGHTAFGGTSSLMNLFSTALYFQMSKHFLFIWSLFHTRPCRKQLYIHSQCLLHLVSRIPAGRLGCFYVAHYLEENTLYICHLWENTKRTQNIHRMFGLVIWAVEWRHCCNWEVKGDHFFTGQDSVTLTENERCLPNCNWRVWNGNVRI